MFTQDIWNYIVEQAVRVLCVCVCVCVCVRALCVRLVRRVYVWTSCTWSLCGSHRLLWPWTSQESAINGSEHNLKPWFVELVVDFGCVLARQENGRASLRRKESLELWAGERDDTCPCACACARKRRKNKATHDHGRCLLAVSNFPSPPSPPSIRNSLDIALEMTEAATRPFTGKYFYEELQGIADGCDVSVSPQPCPRRFAMARRLLARVSASQPHLHRPHSCSGLSTFT